ncbi:MAG: 2-oxo-4-hydroxy-4-carboxy-5-ureidoimidazoline decarboxylase [Steroidobacteraceae bacterium]
MSIAQLAAKLRGISVPESDAADFQRRYGHLFEHSPWVVQRGWQRRPFADREALHAAFRAVVTEAEADEQLALVRAHPELASKFAIAANLTESSRAEQAGAGLDQLSSEEFEQFHALNRAYRQRFGFPFVICVRLTDKAGILAAMHQRLAAEPEVELREALHQIALISALRLADIPTEGVALERLAAQVNRDLGMLGIPAESWLEAHARTQPEAYDVIIIGGGQSGLGAAFGLQREGVRNILILDENRPGLEGPWVNYARMMTLRTPKHLTGIDLGVPSLTYRSWHEARYGAHHWAALDKIARGDWMEYLRWFRRVLNLPLLNQVRVERVDPRGPGLFALTLSGAGAPGATLLARKVVFATGIQGGGEWHVPEQIRALLPAHRYSHSSQPINFAPLRGRRIGILGGGASAFDNAQYALSQGVAEAHVFVRREEMPRVNPIRHMERSGISRHYGLLDDARKYATTAHFISHPQPPTNDTFSRACNYPGFRLHLGAPWQQVRERGDVVVVETPQGEFEFDFLIVSTGTRNDMQLRPELQAFAADIQLWRDRYAPPAGQRNALVDEHPYLGRHFEFTGRDAPAQDRLYGLFAFNFSALASIGLSAASLSGLRFAIPTLVSGIAGQLFLDNRDEILEQFLNYSEPEFHGQWQAS